MGISLHKSYDFLLNPIFYIVTVCIHVYYFVDCYMYAKEIKFKLMCFTSEIQKPIFSLLRRPSSLLL